MTLNFELTTMQHWKTAFLTLLIFGLGGVAGGLITAQVIRGKIEHVKLTTPGREVIGPEWIPQHLGAMQRQVNLTPEQVEKVREIMSRTQREIVRAREDVRLRSRDAMERADQAIMEILTGEQKSQFLEFKKWRRAMFQNQQRPPNGMPPPRPGDRLGDGPGGRPGNRPLDRPPPGRPPQAPQGERPPPQPQQP